MFFKFLACSNIVLQLDALIHLEYALAVCSTDQYFQFEGIGVVEGTIKAGE